MPPRTSLPRRAKTESRAMSASYSTQLSLPPARRTKLLHLPTETLDRIVEIAWPDLVCSGGLAPCRRLQGSYDRLRLESIGVDLERLDLFVAVHKGSPAISNHCRRLVIYCLPNDMDDQLKHLIRLLPNLQHLVFACNGVVASQISMLQPGIFLQPPHLPNLHTLSSPYSPFALPAPPPGTPTVLDLYPQVRCLHLGVRNLAYPHSHATAIWTVPPSINKTGCPSPTHLTELAISLSSPSWRMAHETARLPSDIMRRSPSLARLKLTDLPNVVMLSDLLDSLPSPSNLRYLHLSFELDLDPSGPASWYIVNEGDEDGVTVRVSLASTIRRLSGLVSLTLGTDCSCFDEEALDALRAREPLLRLELVEGYGAFEGPDAILDGLIALGPKAPKELCLEHEEDVEAMDGPTMADLLPDGEELELHDFPCEEEVFGDWVIPERLEDISDVYRAIVEHCRRRGIKLSGTVISSLAVMDRRDRAREEWEELRDDYFRKRGRWQKRPRFGAGAT
ncbi:hypothetical protein NBRC10512_003273 [Rhodotorula toruloides]|uniref:RHTO0S24e01486g1_1 n=2 Tax=Rhodotorula toruloides TaxID=5286 RepID=A0A061BIN7_RHOTO|nr:uncharacterized protein RHTO_04506 [Rhodotorula toruloides NP11]EMS19314.1 hypothetical protein RHTO_04506 [Rhodotorula toruloides NP11]CDR49237.1 RHTO0S24e01486g1_1 [Rhodotorula toruloides]